MIFGIILLVVLVTVVIGLIAWGVTGEPLAFLGVIFVMFQGALIGGIIFVAVHFISKYW